MPILIGNETGNPGLVPPLRNLNDIVDLSGFFELVNELLTVYMEEVGPPEGTDPVFIEDFPKERLSMPDKPFDIITFKTRSVKPAATRNDGTHGRGYVQRQKFTNPEAPRYEIQVLGRWEQFEVIFVIYSKSNSLANRLALWFHKFMCVYGLIQLAFMDRGVQNFEFIERLEDTTDTLENQELYLRQLVYGFRLDNLYSGQLRKLTSITLNTADMAPINLPRT